MRDVDLSQRTVLADDAVHRERVDQFVGQQAADDLLWHLIARFDLVGRAGVF